MLIQFSISRRELVANSISLRTADATQLDSGVALTSAVCTGYLHSVLITNIVQWRTQDFRMGAVEVSCRRRRGGGAWEGVYRVAQKN